MGRRKLEIAFGAITALEAAGIKPGKDVTVISFDAGAKALGMVMDGKINLDVECNPMHGPRVLAIIEEIRRGETPPKYTYVDETSFDASNLSETITLSRGY